MGIHLQRPSEAAALGMRPSCLDAVQQKVETPTKPTWACVIMSGKPKGHASHAKTLTGTIV